MSALFPNVPDSPGVPPVNRDASNTANDDDDLPDDNSDNALGYPAEAPTWGILDSSGAPVLVGDSFVSFDFANDYSVADYPIENGGFQSYNKVQKPFEAKITISKGGSIADRTAFLAEVASIIETTDLYSAVTPDATYPNVNLTHYDYARTSEKGVSLLMVAIHLEQIRVAPDATFSNTQQPSGADTVNNGGVQPQAPTAIQAGSTADGFF